MPIHGRALLDAAILLSEQEAWQMTVGYSSATGVANALSGMIGGCLFGPLGITIGVGISAVGAYYYTKNKYKPIFAILKEDLRPSQQEELIRLLKEAFCDLGPEDVFTIARLMMDKRELGLKMKEIVMTFVYQQVLQNVSDKSDSGYTSKEKYVL
uniref:60 kDa chaperonin n=1 Tax=Lygus hesperus TaxID=30085 RepID=A0A0A9XNG2_LYGHE